MRRRKLLAIPMAATAGALIVASAAFACTSFKGQLKITGDGAGSGTVIATGTGSGMNYKSISAAYAKVASGGNLTYQVNADPAKATNKLPTGRAYQLRWDPYTSATDGDFPTHTAWKYDCMVGTNGSTLGATVTVDSTGAGGPWVRNIGSTTAHTPINGGTGLPYNEAGACISDSSALYGNQAPVTIL